MIFRTIKTALRPTLLSALALILTAIPAFSAEPGKKQILLLAGKPSHGPGQHEHNAGILLLKKCLAQVEKEIKRGAGFVCLHYAVELPSEIGGPQALDWMGGFFEANWSVNPHWTANFKNLPKHPISNGVNPFSSHDEWYFHMRFADVSKGSRTDMLSAKPRS